MSDTLTILQTLPTPEVIPFRLTRDIVDGMGPTGTDGTFSRSAEEIVRILRANASALLTILSAVVSDPLYEWKKSAARARVKQTVAEDDEEQGDDDSAIPDEHDAGSRAIAKIHEKLQGYEEGTSSERQSVEGQVQLLVNSARDPDNLAVLFPGWSPWL